jgi:hypothetical protein
MLTSKEVVTALPWKRFVRLGKVRHVNLFLERSAKINSNSGVVGSPLPAAAKGCSPGVLQILSEHGADINLSCGRHGLPFQAAAASYGSRTEISSP